MKKSIESAVRILALTGAAAAANAQLAIAESAPPMSPNQAKATRLASKITGELYDSRNFPKGVPVPGILNGSVEIKTSIGNNIKYVNPVILVESHSRAKTDKSEKLLNGSWVGIPVYDANGNLSLSPVEVHLGKHNGETQSLQLNNGHNTVLAEAGVFLTEVNGADQLYGFDVQDGDFSPRHITATGMQ